MNQNKQCLRSPALPSTLSMPLAGVNASYGRKLRKLQKFEGFVQVRQWTNVHAQVRLFPTFKYVFCTEKCYCQKAIEVLFLISITFFSPKDQLFPPIRL